MLTKAIGKISKVIIEACSAGLIVGGAVLIYEKIFVTSYQIGGILSNCRGARKAVKDNG